MSCRRKRPLQQKKKVDAQAQAEGRREVAHRQALDEANYADLDQRCGYPAAGLKMTEGLGCRVQGLGSRIWGKLSHPGLGVLAKFFLDWKERGYYRGLNSHEESGPVFLVYLRYLKQT